MKTIFFTICAFFAFTLVSQAQTTREDQGDVQDKIQQEPPREEQRRVENAAAPTNPQAQNNQSQRDADEKLKKEKERSTGKEAENPAVKNTTVTPKGKLSEPDSKPLKSN